MKAKSSCFVCIPREPQLREQEEPKILLCAVFPDPSALTLCLLESVAHPACLSLREGHVAGWGVYKGQNPLGNQPRKVVGSCSGILLVSGKAADVG